MSTPLPDRSIGGLNALSRMRRPDAGTALDVAEAPAIAAAPQAPVEARTPEPQATAPAETTPRAAVRPPAPTRAPKSVASVAGAGKSPQNRPQASSAADSPKEQLATRVSRDVGDRARGAFRASGHLEGEASFAEFVEAALLREIEKREKRYNDGKPFTIAGGRLQSGRPLKS